MNTSEVEIEIEIPSIDTVSDEIRNDILALLEQPKYKHFKLSEIAIAPKEVNVQLDKNI